MGAFDTFITGMTSGNKSIECAHEIYILSLVIEKLQYNAKLWFLNYQ